MVLSPSGVNLSKLARRGVLIGHNQLFDGAGGNLPPLNRLVDVGRVRLLGSSNIFQSDCLRILYLRKRNL